MLGLQTDNMPAASTLLLGDSSNHQVVALGGTAGKDDFSRIRVESLGHRLAGHFHRLLRLPAKRVTCAAGVTILLREEGEHGLHHTRIDTCRGVVVEIDWCMDHPRLSLYRGAG